MFKRAGKTSKGLFDKAWAGLDKYVGEPMNKVAGKMGIESVWPTTMDRECDKAARILRVFTLDGGAQVDAKLNVHDEDAHKKTQRVIKRIPAKALQEAAGLAIFTVFRSGLGFSAASGSGIVISRKADGSWGAPSGLLVHTVGFGFMIGIDVYDVVLVLRTKSAVDSFANPKINLGGELSLVAGPLSGTAMADAGYKQAPLWSYVKSKGFYAGVQLDGTVIIERQDENARFYGVSKISARELLMGSHSMHVPVDAEGLIATIQAASDRKDVNASDIPAGPAPSEAYAQDPHQPAEGFGSLPEYTDLEVVNVTCSTCGSSMTMEELGLHECATTMIVESEPDKLRRAVPAPPTKSVNVTDAETPSGVDGIEDDLHEIQLEDHTEAKESVHEDHSTPNLAQASTVPKLPTAMSEDHIKSSES